MRHSACVMLLSCLLLPFTASSAEPAAAKGKADPVIGRQLDQLGHKYEVDDEGDYKLVFGLGETEDSRSQLVYVRSPLESYGEHRIREIWSPGYLSTTDTFPAAVANRLLEATQDSKMGAWAKQGRYAVFVIKLRAGASASELDDAIEAALQSADEMEASLTPGKDEF